MISNRNISLLGPGKTTLDFSEKKGFEVLAFQEVFPNCIEHLQIIPNYWVCGDPNSYILGMKYLLQNLKNEKLKKTKVLIPKIFTKDISHYRRFCGTTPLIRRQGGWEEFKDLAKQVSKHYVVDYVPTTSTKYIKLFGTNKDLKNLNNPGFEFLRFANKDVIFGTVEFDSESVIGDRFLWGLENKLTSVALPICYYLRAKKVCIYGFDYQGPRFYSADARHPWSDETQKNSSSSEFSLSLLQKWLEWESIHQMKIFSGTKDEISLPNKFLKQYQKEDNNE